jgi:hypothetical protein
MNDPKIAAEKMEWLVETIITAITDRDRVK